MAEQIEEVARTVPGVASRLPSGWKVGAISTLRLTVKNRTLRYDGGGCAVVCDFCGGRAMVGETVEGIARYPINLRYRKAGAIVRRHCASCRS